MKFKSRPVEIEAIQFTMDYIQEVQAFCGFHQDASGVYSVQTFGLITNPDALVVDSYGVVDIVAEVWDKLHNTWVGVKEGQWIIKGFKGEFYPCDPEIFDAKYEPVEESS